VSDRRRRLLSVLGSLLFLVLAPGTFGVYGPYRLTGWRMQPALLPVPGIRALGGVLIALGAASVLESFLRFAIVGLGTPAPVAPPKHLVVSGQYRFVRNPMYVALLAMIIGQALLFGSRHLLLYAAIFWGIVHFWVLAYEEPKLTATFGDSYAEYRRHVRRWWPRLQPWTG
jgi:protein-S-isoprenylcysteine O-methyltransferase Ste14